MTGRRSIDGKAGFTLLETVIALALFSLFLALALQLWMESARLFAASAVRSRDPLLELALRRLRLDLELAVAVPGSVGLWQRDSLPLLQAEGAVSWSLDGDRLNRSFRLAGEDHAVDLAAGVASFRWRKITPQLVEVEIGALQDGDSMLLAANRRLPRPPRAELRRIRLVVHPRGQGTGARY